MLSSKNVVTKKVMGHQNFCRYLGTVLQSDRILTELLMVAGFYRIPLLCPPLMYFTAAKISVNFTQGQQRWEKILASSESFVMFINI